MEKILYWGYIFVGSAGYMVLRLLLPILRKFNGKYCYGIEQRLGCYNGSIAAELTGEPRIWLHASSVGEVQAAEIVINALDRVLPGASFVLTTTTMQGKKVAEKRVADKVTCLLAPLDAAFSVRKSLGKISPDVYICMETELWPVMLTELKKAGVTGVLLNARISERSFQRYLYIRKLIKRLLATFRGIATITEDDARRFIELGAEKHRVAACGNIKVGAMSDPSEELKFQQRTLLQAGDRAIFTCGSTHTGEEVQLLEAYEKLKAASPVLWVIAPRHLERLGEITELLERVGLEYDLYSKLKSGATGGRPVVVVDTMGDLAKIYSAGDYIFCGGSLVNRGGHNIMEVIKWGYPVYYGSDMSDFEESAQKLEQAGCGFRVCDAKELAALLLDHASHPEIYAAACDKAVYTAQNWKGPVEKQITALRKAVQLW